MVVSAGCITLLVSLNIATVSVLWLFLEVPCVGLQCVNVVFSGHTHLFFGPIPDVFDQHSLDSRRTIVLLAGS